MVKKLQKLAERKSGGGSGLGGVGALLDSEFAQTVRDSAQQIWLAGLGAFTKAQGEGTKAFEALVKQGSAMQRKTQAVAEEKMGDVAGRMSNLAGDVGAKAGQHWDKLESIFEERVARALNKLGVPSSKDVHALIERIDALSATVAAMPGGTPARQAAAGKSPLPKAGAKKAAKAARPKAKGAAADGNSQAGSTAQASASSAAAKRGARKSSPRKAAAA